MKLRTGILIGLVAPFLASPAHAQRDITVVNMIPRSLSGETNQDSEPNLAVNPRFREFMVASAFTSNPTGDTARAPVFISTDAGATWSLNNILPSVNGRTYDITVAYGDATAFDTSGVVYAAILKRPFLMMILRSDDPFGSAMMDSLLAREDIDQPYVDAITVAWGGTRSDAVYVGNNDWSGFPRTATVDFSPDATTDPPADFRIAHLEQRETEFGNRPAIRTTAHSDGMVYAIFYHNQRGGFWGNATCDVVVVRDDDFGLGLNPFGALADAADGAAGVRVVRDVTVAAGPPLLGNNRLIGSNLSIAVDPRNASTLYIAWADSARDGRNTLHVRRSDDGGATWSRDLLTLGNAINPALAVNDIGEVGFLYQQLAGTGAAERWVTHARVSDDEGESWEDYPLADTPADDPPWDSNSPYLGDYADLVAVGHEFYGVFAASNIPNRDHFPQGVSYQRNADFKAQRLLDADAATPVATSIDPFFFAIRPTSPVPDCRRYPGMCAPLLMDEGILEFICGTKPCLAIDRLPRNCLVKFDCGGCGTTVLCPPWYHIYLEDLDADVWSVGVYTSLGGHVRHDVNRVQDGVVVSFRPSQRLFKEGEIGDYVLVFRGEHVEPGAKFVIRTRLEVSDYAFAEHMKRGGREEK